MPKTPDYFHDKSILITGAASGIGRATAKIFAREGANVACVDINADDNRRTAEMVAQQGARSAAITADVSSRAAVDEMVAESLEKLGRIDFLFNCAGAAGRRSKFLEIDDELWEKTYALNVNAPFYATQAVLPHMLERGKGVIVNMASMSYKRGGPGASIHYASAKAAVWSLTLGVAREFADRGIRCLSISPGPVKTPFQAASNTPPELMERFIADVPMKRWCEPEEVGELVLFVCSDAAEYMTADTIYINGGGGWR